MNIQNTSIICKLEENRFLAKFRTSNGAQLIKEFNPENWKTKSIFVRGARLLKRIKENSQIESE